MLKKSERMSSRIFAGAFKFGKRIKINHGLAIINEKGRNKHKLAVTVKKKDHKSAVTRNKIRRRAYEALRVTKKEIESEKKEMQGGIWIFKGSGKEHFEALKQSARQILEK